MIALGECGIDWEGAYKGTFWSKGTVFMLKVLDYIGISHLSKVNKCACLISASYCNKVYLK